MNSTLVVGYMENREDWRQFAVMVYRKSRKVCLSTFVEWIVIEEANS